MTDDLVKRLRYDAKKYADDICGEAADRIEQLEAALKRIAEHDMQAIALDALRPNERIREMKDGKKDRG
jgi:hypothetical protein